MCVFNGYAMCALDKKREQKLIFSQLIQNIHTLVTVYCARFTKGDDEKILKSIAKY